MRTPTSPVAILTMSAVAAGASLIAAPAVAAPPDFRDRDIQLASGGTALVYDGSGGPMLPPPQFLDAVNTLYLQPGGFTGVTQAALLPNELYPITGVKSMGFGASVSHGQPIMLSDIQSQIAAGGVTSENPLVVFGYSQSAAVASQVMPQLRDAGVPSDLVHFVLVGDVNNPNGGLLNTFDSPTGNSWAFTAANFPFSSPTPSDLYPTDIYSLEYDASADFPHYPLNLLSVLNALIGNFTQHFIYPDLTPEQVESAILLPGSAALSGRPHRLLHDPERESAAADAAAVPSRDRQATV